MKAPMLIPAVAASGLALGVVNAQPCAAQTAPSLDARAGWTADNWPQGETIRFSAAPSLERYAYAVQINRASPAAGAIVRLVN